MAKIEQAANVNLVSRISAGTYFKGEIVSPNDLRIDGKFDGSIVSEGKVVIGESAEVNATIVCVNADVWGKAHGCFTVKDIMSIKSECSVDGELKVRRLIVELGASFNGTCKMISEQDYDTAVAEMLKTGPAREKAAEQPAGENVKRKA